ncbi:7003_t:CDS:2 [Diversispora eburnea]|uniref:Queuine tRNA-ribosyltransferase accessory subunit 2 n=1 Tax=Diversispora eburnea TaxID=1213867 RepID=A0A9N8V178_9GLOM|nr:7003_t:CDS:2 [Diversispora eburnea]
MASTFSFELIVKSDRCFRLGRIICLRNKERKVMSTPNFLAYTVRGSVPHLTPDNLREISVEALEIPLENFLEIQPPPSSLYPHGAHKFFNFENLLLFFDIRDPGELKQVSFNTDKFVSVFTLHGVCKITSDTYVKYINSYNPDAVISLADMTTFQKTPGLKRIKKSVNRTLDWLDYALENIKEGIQIFGALVGHNNHEERIRSAHETANRNVAGFLLNGLDLGTTSRERLDLLKISISNLPDDKPRIAYGFENPVDILRGIFEGIDIFDGSYPSKKTEEGNALIFTLENEELINDDDTGKSLLLYLHDEKYKTDFRPLLSSCKCYACRNHTRAYIHHLLKTREMLATVLLMR